MPLEEGYKIKGGIELVSFEVLQYHDEICTDSPYQRYLVLHYVGVDCTNSQIEAISRALTRPRNKLTTIDEPIDLLGKSCEFITDILNKSENVLGRYVFKCTKGGYLESEKFSSDSKSLSEKLIYDYPLPARSVCAIPNIPVSDFSGIPAIFSNYESQKISEYSKTNLWAAQLARGFDNFSSEVPTLEAIESTLSTEHQLKKWLITAEGSGIVAIRTDPYLLQDLSLWSLASTRFVDLLILNQRTPIPLFAISVAICVKLKLRLWEALKLIPNRGGLIIVRNSSGSLTNSW